MRLPRLPAAALVLLLSACASPPAEPPPGPALPPEPPVSYPAELRDRLVELAGREWEAFGSAITDRRGPESRELVPGLRQEDPRVFHLVQAYWNAVREERPEWDDYLLQQRAQRRAFAPAWDRQPWSAAFISYLQRSAGVDRAEFPWTAAHRVYLDHAILASRQWGERALYTPLELEQHAPQPGDLVCGDRSRAPEPRLRSVAERAAELGRARGLHCDLVVASAEGVLALVGGNLDDAVRMVYLPLDESGRIPRLPEGAIAGATPFAVLRLNVPAPDPASLLLSSLPK